MGTPVDGHDYLGRDDCDADCTGRVNLLDGVTQPFRGDASARVCPVGHRAHLELLGPTASLAIGGKG